MEAVESDPTTFDLEAEIAKTIELIENLRGAEESMKQRHSMLLGEHNKIWEQIHRNKHRKLKKWIDKLMPLIESLENFPDQQEPDHMKIQSLKELAEPVQRLKIQFQHGNKNLATERKLAKELQQKKEIEEKQRVDQINQGKTQDRYYSNRPYNGGRVLPEKNTQGLIRIWVEEVMYVCSLVLHDSKNLAAALRNSDCHLLHLGKTTFEFYATQNIGRAEFEKHWGTMKSDKKSLEVIKFELVKESRRHQEGYDESERLREKSLVLSKSFDVIINEWNSIDKEKKAAHKYLWKLQWKKRSQVLGEN